jgi:hypothetical protein
MTRLLSFQVEGYKNFRAPVRLVISTVAYAEKLFDLKQRWRDTFDLGVILGGLEAKGIEVQPFDARHAVETAARLGEQYPDDAAWQRAKRDRCVRCLGLAKGAAPPGTGQIERIGLDVLEAALRGLPERLT